MTIAADEPLASGPYVGNGVTDTFGFAFTVFADGEIDVIVKDALGAEMLLVRGTDYAMAPAGGGYPAEGGTVTLTAPLPTGEQLVILPRITPSQERPFSSQSSITLQEIEDALDKLTALTRQLIEQGQRSITASAFEPAAAEQLLANVNAVIGLETEIVAVSGSLAELSAVAGSIASVDAVAAALPAVAASDPTRYRSTDRIINGDFSVWQRGTSTTANYYGADRWVNGNEGGTVTQTRQAHTIGNRLGANTPQFYLRQTVVGQSLPAHFAVTQQRLEGVRSFAGETVTVLGWARRDIGSGNMVVELSQSFGTGGSPSPLVSISPQLVTLQGSGLWTRFAATFVLPGIAGRTLGTNGDDALSVNFWLSAGADRADRVGGLIGLQTVGVDLWGVHILRGTYAAADAGNYVARPAEETLAACERFYETGSIAITGNYNSGAGYFVRQNLRTTKRAAPTFTRASTFASQFPAGGTISGNAQFVQDDRVANGTGPGGFATTYTADAEL